MAPRGALKLGWLFRVVLIWEEEAWTNHGVLAAPGRDVTLGGTALRTVS